MYPVPCSPVTPGTSWKCNRYLGTEPPLGSRNIPKRGVHCSSGSTPASSSEASVSSQGAILIDPNDASDRPHLLLCLRDGVHDGRNGTTGEPLVISERLRFVRDQSLGPPCQPAAPAGTRRPPNAPQLTQCRRPRGGAVRPPGASSRGTRAGATDRCLTAAGHLGGTGGTCWLVSQGAW